jgi:hypothetical protein
MDTTNTSEVSVGVGGGAVLFEVVVGGRAVQCSIERDALERYFWLPIGASDARLLKAFGDGQRRISAIAERKALQSSAVTVELRRKILISRKLTIE